MGWRGKQEVNRLRVRKWLAVVQATSLIGLSALSALLAVAVLPAYTVFAVVWLQAPAGRVIAITGPAALLFLLLAAAAVFFGVRKMQASL